MITPADERRCDTAGLAPAFAGVPEVWRRSVGECLALIDLLDARLEPLERELNPFAKADPRAVLLDTIPRIAKL